MLEGVLVMAVRYLASFAMQSAGLTLPFTSLITIYETLQNEHHFTNAHHKSACQ